MSENRKFDNFVGGWQTHEAALDRAVGLYWTNRADAIEARKAKEAKAREEEMGTPFALDEEEVRRFDEKVKRGEGSDCDIWIAGKNSDGYGKFWLRGKSKRAHVVAWQHANGRLANPSRSMVIAHLCEREACVKPSHLNEQTQQQNMLYADTSIPARERAKTHCLDGHELTKENCRSYAWALGERSCQICHIAYGRERSAQLKEAARALGITQLEYRHLYGQGMAAATAIANDPGCEVEHRKK